MRTPAFDGCFIALRGADDRLLAGEAESMQQTAHVADVQADAEAIADHRRDARQRPEIGGETRGERYGTNDAGQVALLLDRQLGLTTGVRARSESGFAAARQRPFPAFHARQIAQPIRRATSAFDNPFRGSEAARRRRASNSAALPFGLMTLGKNPTVCRFVQNARVSKALLPQIRIVGLSLHEDSDLAEAMLEAGADSYVAKNAPAGEILSAIRGDGG